MSTEPHDKQPSIEQRLQTLEKGAEKKTWCDFLQAVGTILIAVVGGFYTLNQTKLAARQEAAQSKYQGRMQAIQLQANREKADADLRANMFSSLAGQFFKGDLKPKDRVLLLALFENNFQEFFDAGPLFAMVNNDLSPDEKKEFRKLALGMAERQELMLGAGLISATNLAQINDVVNVPLGVNGTKMLNIQLIDIQDDFIRVRVKPTNPTQFKFDQTEFNVTFFDMPLTDNTELPDHERFAITLKSCDRVKGASFKVFELPGGLFTSRERPDFHSFTKTVEQKE